ncbi:unnamed protein product [Urochloa humidicola]
MLGTITLHSATIEELHVTGGQLRGVDIVAPMLKEFTLRSDVFVDFTMSLLAPNVENLWWNCWSIFGNPGVAIDGSNMWRLNHLELKTEERVFILVLDIERPYCSTQVRNLQEMFQLPNISVLELRVKEARGHVYGAMVLNVLRICNAIQRLKLINDHHVFWKTDEACPPDCPCNHPQN